MSIAFPFVSNSLLLFNKRFSGDSFYLPALNLLIIILIHNIVIVNFIIICDVFYV